MTTSTCAEPAGTVGFFLCRAGQHLRAAAIESPRQEARILLAHALSCRQEDLLRDPRAAVPPAAAKAEQLALAAGRWAPEPAHLAALVALAVALVQESRALLIATIAVCLYGLVHEMTRPELEHVYCPCSTCTTPPADTDIDGGLR